jgi:glycosyltransferase involved in cell wall biosynthesis
MERHVLELSMQQRRAGLDVVQVYSTGCTGHPGDIRVLGGWQVLHLRPQWIRDLLFYAATTLEVVRRRVYADVLHVHGDWSAFLFGQVLARCVRARVRVASLHGHVPRQERRKWLYRLACRGYGVRYATGVQEARLLSRWTGRHWHWITSGVSASLQPVGSVPRSTDILAAGSLVAVKNMGLVLDVAALLPHRRFRIAGGGPLADALADRVRASRLTNVELVGPVSHEEMGREFAAARLFLLTSTREGTPTVVLEAIAAGLPVVVTPCNDFSDIVVQGRGGFVVADWSAEEIAAHVESVLNDPGLWDAMSRFNKGRGRDFSWPAVAARVTELILRD